MGEPIRVLHILQRMEAGGTQALLMNIYRKIDRTKNSFTMMKLKKWVDMFTNCLSGRI